MTADTVPTGAPPADGPAAPSWPARHAVALLAVASAVATLVGNAGGVATGDDGVGYRAIADSLLRGDGLGFHLERPLTIWPPVWPALMAAVAKVTPLGTPGAAVVLNAVTVALAVVVVNRLLRRLVVDPRLVLLGTAVVALGSSTMGFGHLLMTDLAFAVVVGVWMLTLLRSTEERAWWWPAAAGAWVWLAFGLRYVGVALVGIGGLWLLLERTRPFRHRVGRAAGYGAVSVVVPVLWMLRNHGIDGTYTGERFPSARGLVDNGFDVLATLGRFGLPGVVNGATKVWAVLGALGLGAAVALAWKVLGAPGEVAGIALDPPVAPAGRVRRAVALLGRGPGLLLLTAGLYLAYMLYVRTTTALNQLDLRLLNPAYFPLLALAMVLADRTRLLGPDTAQPWHRRSVAAVTAWAALNLLAGFAAVVLFTTGDPFFTGNYSSDVFQRVRANPALDAVPDGCRVYSNLPNGLYPRLESRWSPRRTGLESDERVPELRDITATLASTPSCLVWVDQPPRYGHLWTLAQLQQRLRLERLAQQGDVTVFRMLARPG